MKSRTLELKTLIDKRACCQQVKLFRSMFGESVEVEEGLCLDVCGLFDFPWASQSLLTAKAGKAYEEARAKAGKAYEEARAKAWKAYEEVGAKAWKAYKEAEAVEFAKAYVSDKGE